MFALFGSTKRPKRSAAARVKKLASKVAKMEAKAKLKDAEQRLKAKLAKMRGL